VDWDFPATVREVVLMGTYAQVGWLRWPGARQHRAVELALAQVGLSELADRPIGALSGGQQQRVFVARALVQDAELLLLDEPFQGVDAATEQALIEVLRHQRNQGRTVLAVHHDLHTVRDYFDWLVLLRGTVLACGPTAAVFTRANLQAAYGRLLLMPEGLAPGGDGARQADKP
jgi:manganese/zinc/iron transport system ATP- binding protein